MILMDKLLMSADIPDKIEVNCGTIHGFRGDECDIIIALFNPPPYISTNREMLLNSRILLMWQLAVQKITDLYLFRMIILKMWIIFGLLIS